MLYWDTLFAWARATQIIVVNRWKVECSIQRGKASWNGTFHLSFHKTIPTIALINNHYLYSEPLSCNLHSEWYSTETLSSKYFPLHSFIFFQWCKTAGSLYDNIELERMVAAFKSCLYFPQTVNSKSGFSSTSHIKIENPNCTKLTRFTYPPK